MSRSAWLRRGMVESSHPEWDWHVEPVVSARGEKIHAMFATNSNYTACGRHMRRPEIRVPERASDVCQWCQKTLRAEGIL